MILVWVVFRDPSLDHRLVILGAVLPDLVDGPLGGARLLHTLTANVALLLVVMVATRGRRLARRRGLALVLGSFAHLLFDGVWTDTSTFWWPVTGYRLTAPLPALDRGLAVLMIQELVGAVALSWFWRRFGLGDPAVRGPFLRTGHLPRQT